ncbi:RNA polymerase I associated factor, A49-like protein [Phanerochaete sordida]|uniref:RNA polymerase I associated factor, A49-like protein n=1 Tax=Phanerochaete sordida TaxID=48140 RepID=A0A9P3GEK4_9APHY|nr:RNA polymerase I associated factor, A49-like protein [Phanerochaete sordida]
MASSTLKKRKRGSDDSEEVTLQISGQQEQVGPVLASFPALQPPKSTAFRLYTKKGQADVSSSKNATLVGETDTVEFVSSAESEQAAAGCSYYVGIYNKKTKTTVLRPAPLHILARNVKALKNLKPMEVSVDERMKLRNNLGETFGTKKAKAAIRAHERNRVDIDAMRGVAGHLQEDIQGNTESLPTQDEAKAAADGSRLIPPYNADAQRPEEVYKLHDIVPEAELNSIQINALKAMGSNKQRVDSLPYSRSNWINQHLSLLFSAPKPNKIELKILVYISAMLAFRAASRVVSDKQVLQERLKSVPSIVVDGLLSRFTEASRDTNQAKITPAMETMLLTHMFALCLRVDDYATDTTLIAKDLSMSVAKVNPLFKSLGCRIDTLNAADLKRLGLPDSAGATKRAVLKVPLEFPKPRVKRARR